MEDPDMKDPNTPDLNMDNSAMRDRGMEDPTTSESDMENSSTPESPTKDSTSEDAATQGADIEDAAIHNVMIQDDAVKYRSIQDTTIYHRSVNDEALQNTPIGREVVDEIQNEAVSSGAIEDATNQLEAIKVDAIQDASIRDEFIKDKGLQDAIIPDGTIEDEAPQNTAVHHEATGAIKDKVIQSTTSLIGVAQNGDALQHGFVEDETVENAAIDKESAQEKATQNRSVNDGAFQDDAMQWAAAEYEAAVAVAPAICEAMQYEAIQFAIATYEAMQFAAAEYDGSMLFAAATYDAMQYEALQYEAAECEAADIVATEACEAMQDEAIQFAVATYEAVQQTVLANRTTEVSEVDFANTLATNFPTTTEESPVMKPNEVSRLRDMVCRAMAARMRRLDKIIIRRLALDRNARFRSGGSNKGGAGGQIPGQSQGKGSGSPNGNGSQAPSPTSLHASQSSSSIAPRVPQLPNSPSFAQSMSLDSPVGAQTNGDNKGLNAYTLPRPIPLWLNPAHAKHIVKGNFMTLSARPKTVEEGEWIAHQVVEHYRILWNFVRVIHDKDEDGTTICNSRTCPKMSAGANHSFTWLNSRKEPVEVPANEYIALMQRWISGKTDNTSIFPTDPAGVSFAHNTAGPTASSATYASGGLNTPGSNTPIPAGPTTLNASLSQLAGQGDWVGKSSGFPPDFIDVCKTIFRQMFRVYAHLYWAHFVDPFYHLNLEKHLNSCFSHFVLTATALEMLQPHELEPMQPLIDLWAASGTFPPESKAYEYANVKAGEQLLVMAGVPAA